MVPFEGLLGSTEIAPTAAKANLICVYFKSPMYSLYQKEGDKLPLSSKLLHRN